MRHAGAEARLNAQAADSHGRAGAQRARGRPHIHPGVRPAPALLCVASIATAMFGQSDSCLRGRPSFISRFISSRIEQVGAQAGFRGVHHLDLPGQVVPSIDKSPGLISVQGCASWQVLAAAMAPACAGQPANVFHAAALVSGPRMQQSVQSLRGDPGGPEKGKAATPCKPVPLSGMAC